METFLVLSGSGYHNSMGFWFSDWWISSLGGLPGLLVLLWPSCSLCAPWSLDLSLTGSSALPIDLGLFPKVSPGKLVAVYEATSFSVTPLSKGELLHRYHVAEDARMSQGRSLRLSWGHFVHRNFKSGERKSCESVFPPFPKGIAKEMSLSFRLPLNMLPLIGQVGGYICVFISLSFTCPKQLTTIPPFCPCLPPVLIFFLPQGHLFLPFLGTVMIKQLPENMFY